MDRVRSIRRAAWWAALIASIVALATGVRLQGMAGADPLLEAILRLALSLGAVLVVSLNLDHRLEVGRWFRGSDTTRMRVAVVTIGDLAVMILAFRFWSAGLPLALVTGVAYTHGIADGNVGHLRR